MEFNNTLEVLLPPAETWTVLLDIERIARCIPGAELTEVVDENTYKGKVAIRLGPVALSLVGQARFEEIDHLQHKARMRTQGSDPKGRGSSDAVIEFRLEPAGSGTLVLIHSDVKLSGSIAQYGRGSGIIQSFASQIINQFGQALKAQLAQVPPVVVLPGVQPDAVAVNGTPAPPPVKPISGLTLLVTSLYDALVRRFRRKLRSSK